MQLPIVVGVNIGLGLLQVYNLIAAIPLLLYAVIAGDGLPPAVRAALTSPDIVLMTAGILLFGIWLFSLQNAAATVSYLDFTKQREAAATAVVVAQRADPDDLRNLRNSRMK